MLFDTKYKRRTQILFYRRFAQEKQHFTFLEFTPFELKPEFDLQINNSGWKAPYRNSDVKHKNALFSAALTPFCPV
jgi:hypothetical protein